jgi:hypothetical protein
MTTITFELPDEVAERARAEGLLDPERFRELLEQALTHAANASEPGEAGRHGGGLDNPAPDETKAFDRRRPCARLANSARLHDGLICSGDTGDWESA